MEAYELGGERIARRHTTKTDEPLEFFGHDSAPNPQEYLFAALNACMLFGYATKAAVLGIELQEVRIETRGSIDIRGAMGLAPVKPGFDSIACTVHLKARGGREQLEELHQAVLGTLTQRLQPDERDSPRAHAGRRLSRGHGRGRRIHAPASSFPLLELSRSHEHGALSARQSHLVAGLSLSLSTPFSCVPRATSSSLRSLGDLDADLTEIRERVGVDVLARDEAVPHRDDVHPVPDQLLARRRVALTGANDFDAEGGARRPLLDDQTFAHVEPARVEGEVGERREDGLDDLADLCLSDASPPLV